MFVQCLHQHTPLAEVVETLSEHGGAGVIKDYLNYKGHVCREVYSAQAQNMEQPLREVEKKWPEYTNERLFTDTPVYLQEAAAEKAPNQEKMEHRALQCGLEWKRKYIDEDVQALQEHK